MARSGINIKHGAKTDNASPEGKLKLRRYFLDKYHANTVPVVLDCCQATGVLWGQLRREYKVKYMGVDRMPKRGRMKLDSSRLLLSPALPYDVIDVDTYGSPWQHWGNLLPNIIKPTTVFLTLGQVGAMTAVDSAVLKAVGLAKMERRIPQSLRWKLDQIAVESCLAMCYHYSVRIAEALEVQPPGRNARYFGLHIIPNRAPAPHRRTIANR